MTTSILWNLGSGTLIGLGVGLALKTALKWALTGLGFLTILLVLMMKGGFITIHWDALTQGLETTVASVGGMIDLALADLTAQLAGFGAGLALGFKFK